MLSYLDIEQTPLVALHCYGRGEFDTTHFSANAQAMRPSITAFCCSGNWGAMGWTQGEHHGLLLRCEIRHISQSAAPGKYVVVKPSLYVCVLGHVGHAAPAYSRLNQLWLITNVVVDIVIAVAMTYLVSYAGL